MATNAPQTKHVKIDIKGMTCAACSASVARALRRADGELQVNVNLATNSATVLCDPSVSEQMLVEIVNKTGFSGTRKTPFRHTEEPLPHHHDEKTPQKQAPDNRKEEQYARSGTQKKEMRNKITEMVFN